jgi:hypothetical protein
MALEDVPPAARERVGPGTNRRDRKRDRGNEPECRDRDQRDVYRRARDEADETFAERPWLSKGASFDSSCYVITRSLLNRLMFRIITGIVSSSMITATAAPRPGLPLNVSVNMVYAITRLDVPGPPEVIT